MKNRTFFKFQFLTLVVSCLFSVGLLAAQLGDKALVERDLNVLMKKGLESALQQLDETRQVVPFLMMVKQNGELAVIYVPQTDDVEGVSVDKQIFALRNKGQGAASFGDVRAALVCYYTTMKLGEVAHQGLMFEIEHEAKLAMARFLPITMKEDEKLVVHTEKLFTEGKPLVIFN